MTDVGITPAMWYATRPPAAMIKPSQQSETLVKVPDIAAKTAALGPQVWEAATTGGSAAYCKRLLEEEPSERIGIALADVKSGTSGAMDLIRVARSKGDFPGKVPQLAHGPVMLSTTRRRRACR